jgi:hypothetical protein
LDNRNNLSCVLVVNAVLLHTGYYSPSATPPPNSISELRATIRILESQKSTYIWPRGLGGSIVLQFLLVRHLPNICTINMFQ